MIEIKTASWQWLSLLLLTCLVFALAETDNAGNTILLTVLAATLIKGALVIDRFMALRHVGGPWRLIVLGWLLLVQGVIGLSFYRF